MANELKPEDVMRALEICAKPYSQDKVQNCKTCPYWLRECDKEFIPDVISLLREKDAEIERFKAEMKILRCEDCWNLAKAEAITEFADRLAERLNRNSIFEGITMSAGETVYDVIDQIAKEMKGETDGKTDL